VLSFLHVQRPGPQFTHTPSHARAAQVHLVPLFCRSLTPSSILFPLMYRMATRLSLRPRATVTPPPWSSSWRQARTRTRRTRQERLREIERWNGGRAEGHTPTTHPRGQRTTCAMPGVRVGVLLKNKLFFIFEHFSQKKWKKNTRTSMVTAVTSLPRVCFFIFHYESGLVLKTVFDKKKIGAHFPRFFFFHFRALPTDKMEKEHAHFNGGGLNKLATCSLL